MPDPVVDPAAFEAMSASLGDPEAIRRVLTLYLTEASEQIELIARQSDASLQEVRVVAHRLKGNAGMLGAVQLVEACRRLESAIDEGRSGEFAALVETVLVESERVSTWVGEQLRIL